MPGCLRVLRLLEHCRPIPVCRIIVASEDSNRLYSTGRSFVPLIAQNMRPQSLEDCLSSVVVEVAYVVDWTVAVTYM